MNGFIEVTDCCGKFLLNTATFENVRGNEIELSNGSTYKVKETYSELKALIEAKRFVQRVVTKGCEREWKI